MAARRSGTALVCAVSRPTRRRRSVIAVMYLRVPRVLRDLVVQYRVLLAFSVLYIAIGGALLTAMHRPWPIALTTPWFTRMWVCGSTFWLIVHVLERHRGHRARLSADQFLGALLLATLAVPVQVTFQSLKQSLAKERGFPWDSALAQFDRVLHGGPAWHWLAFLFDRPALLKIIDVLYVMWFLVLVTMLVWLFWTHMRAFRQRAALSLLILWVGAGTFAAWVFASAGPCYNTANDPDAADLMARLDASHSALIARRAQHGVWGALQNDQWAPFGGVSAMPSLHVGLAVLVAIIVSQRSRRAGAVLWGYVLLIQIGSVILGWHYAIDGYAGALGAWGSWWLAGLLVRRSNGVATARPDSLKVVSNEHTQYALTDLR